MLRAYDFRARLLLPELGRFVQEDPVGFIDSTNLYQGLAGNWPVLSDPSGKEILAGEILGISPYNLLTGTQAHSRWSDLMRTRRSSAFLNTPISSILMRTRGTIATSHGDRRPDLAQYESDKTFTVWELKPRSYDPVHGGKGRSNLLHRQLQKYLTGLDPARLGNPSDLHLTREVVPGLISNGVQSYEMHAYPAENSPGLVLYELLPARLEQKSPLEVAVKETTRRLPCIANRVITGTVIGAFGGAVTGTTIGATTGGVTLPVTVPGAIVVGANIGAAGGGVVALQECWAQ